MTYKSNGKACSGGATRQTVFVMKGNWIGYLKVKKVLTGRNKHFPLASKCRSSDSIRAGVRPLNINSKN